MNTGSHPAVKIVIYLFAKKTAQAETEKA